MTLTNPHNLRIDIDGLMARLMQLGQDGALEGGGVCRLALSDADKAGRDRVTGWMRALGLEVSIDHIGNMIGVRAGQENLAPVMIGSHIDTVATGGLYDGNLGVLAGLEIIAALNAAGVQTRRPIAVAAFTNEEGARFAPDMMGSAVDRGSLEIGAALAAADADGLTVGEELARIGYRGPAEPGHITPHCFFELHVEQGPVLEEAGFEIGAVTGVQGISWMEYVIEGVSNHAGTTPMRLRRDAGHAAAVIAVEARQIAAKLGGDQVATVGVCALDPGLVNVIARRARITVDLRNTDEALLRRAEAMMAEVVRETAAREQVTITGRRLARFEPVAFDPGMIGLVHDIAAADGRKVMRMPSGAGHDAQMFAPHCPTGMVFVPSKGGISHNIREHTDPEQLQAGADVLMQAVLAKAEETEARS
ncbi:MAG: Zn-dependent hydrolase [Hyphomicrobiales bacterium]|nr:MAG: Zn-dependent hydrolase [Hyphomicrobiales bacterium]